MHTQMSSSETDPLFVIPDISRYYCRLVDGDVIMHLPPGYRFLPSDEEIVIEYLKKKNENKKLPPNSIKEVEIYRYTPEELAESYDQMNNGHDCYFFTSLPQYRNDGTIQVSDEGYWKATGRDKDITHEGLKVGSEKVFVYFKGKSCTGIKTNWIIHEFRVEDGVLEDIGMNNWALCRMYDKRKHDLFIKETSIADEEIII